MEISDKRIIAFFNDHPDLDPEATILKFIDIMVALQEHMSSNLNNSAILSIVESINNINNKMDKMSDNVQLQFTSKMNEIKKDYMDELKMLLTYNVTEKIEPLLKEQNAILFEKTNHMIHSILPKNEDVVVQKLEGVIRQFQENVSADTKQLLTNSMDVKTFHQYFHSFDDKISKAIASSQDVLNNSLSNAEKRLDSRMSAITENSTTVSTSLNESVSNLLNKFENSSVKGKLSENLLMNVIVDLYPTADITSVGQTKETGDIMMERHNKPKILIENKDWNRPVIQAEVTKFIRDIDTQKCSGIFLSQHGRITTKENYEINLHGEHVLVYVHDVNNEPEKIKLAVDIIDHLSEKLAEIVEDDNITITNDMLSHINHEYQQFITTKTNLIKSSKEFHKNLMKQLDDIQLPSLENFLSNKFAIASNKFVCEYCGFCGKNQQSKSAHLRGCKSKKQVDDAN